MKICIPSSNRAETITTTKLFTKALVFVPESQKHEYAENLENEIIPVPDDIKGITKTRNFILDYVNDDCLMIDDDLKEVGYFRGGIRINLFNPDYEDELINLFERCFQLTRQMGFELFGVEAAGSLFAQHVFKPISYKGAINGTCIGIAKTVSRFDESYPVKEDFEFILRSYLKHGGYLKFNHFYLRTKHWANAGGCVDYRTNQMEMDCVEKLGEKYNGLFKVGAGKNQFHTKITI
ncbi:hypothetical protein GO491_11725 [Flavobacteriaceae bacterium Ap0902]|nr:hypothetical protein [Flavobacteriaceae bacterium Ap0902]